MALKPETGITVGVLSAILAYGIFKTEVGGSLTAVKMSQPHNSMYQGTINQAAWTSAAVVAGIALLTRDPTVFLIGGAVDSALIWKYKHANMVNPANGQVVMPPVQGANTPSSTVNPAAQ